MLQITQYFRRWRRGPCAGFQRSLSGPCFSCSVARITSLGVTVGEPFGTEERIYADDGKLARVFERFVIQAFFLDAAARVHGFHGPQYAATFRNAVKLGVISGFFHQFRQFFDDEGPLDRIFVLRRAQLAVNDELDGHRAANGFFRGRGDGLVVRIGVQRVAVVVNGIQRLQRGADVVKVDFLCVQRAARGLDVVLEHLRAGIGPVFVAQGFSPNAACHTADDGILGIDAVAEEERQVGPELVDVHAAAQVILHVRKSVGR